MVQLLVSPTSEIMLHADIANVVAPLVSNCLAGEERFVVGMCCAVMVGFVAAVCRWFEMRLQESRLPRFRPRLCPLKVIGDGGCSP